jgi:hypothetical protein
MCQSRGVVSQKTCRVDTVTDTRELDQAITEALAVIDKGLGEMLHRELVSTNEVADLLLDLRTVLATPSADGEVEAEDGVAVAS